MFSCLEDLIDGFQTAVAESKLEIFNLETRNWAETWAEFWKCSQSLSKGQNSVQFSGQSSNREIGNSFFLKS